MFRATMPANDGMLFVFDEPAHAVLLDEEHAAAAVDRLRRRRRQHRQHRRHEPQTLDSHCSAKPVRYVLEMNQGWFAKRGIKPGASCGQPFAADHGRRSRSSQALSA